MSMDWGAVGERGGDRKGRIGLGKWCTVKLGLQKKEKSLVARANFCSIYTLMMADFNPLM